MKKISIINLNKAGAEASNKLIQDLYKINPEFELTVYTKTEGSNNTAQIITFDKIDDIINEMWNKSDAIIWFAATGIVIRKIAPLIESKVKDPAIIVINLDYTQVIPLLSGHIGGANELSLELANINAKLTPFITTATDTLKILAFDNFAKKMNWEIINIDALASVSNSLINNHPINLITYKSVLELLKEEGLNFNNINFINIEEELPQADNNIPTVVFSPVVTKESFNEFKTCLKIQIKPFAIGMGLNRNTPYEELKSDLDSFLREHSLNINNISSISSFEAKNDEPGLLQLAETLKIKLEFFNKDSINNIESEFSNSQATKFFNIKGVAEPSAVLSAPMKTLFIKKIKYKNTTIAAAF